MRTLVARIARLRDLSIKYKLFLSYSALAALLIGVLLGVNAHLTTRTSLRQTLRSAQQVFGQTRAYLQFKMESAGGLLYLLATSSTVQSLMERTADYYREDIGRWPIDFQSLGQVALPTGVHAFVSAVRFYMKYGLASVFENEEVMSLERAQGHPWFGRLVEQKRAVYWFCEEQPSEGTQGRESRYVSAAKGVFGRQEVTELVGIVRLDVPASALESILANAMLTEGSGAALIGRDGSTVCATGAPAPAGLWSAVCSARGNRFDDESWNLLTLGGARLLVGTQGVRSSDWVLLLHIPYREIISMSIGSRRQMILVSLLVVPVALVLALLVAGSGTRRIESLIAKTRRVVQGDFSVELEPTNDDEIGQLTRSFNYMVGEVERLMQERYRLGKEVKNLELKALQAQINPHFLYNTLDLINWMARRQKAPEIGDLVAALSRFYRLSLGQGNDTVALRDELEHVQVYFRIQNMRYGQKLRLHIEVPDELLDCPILKLVLQPLVENALFHGIMAGEHEAGTVRIRGEARDGVLLIEVEDDGVGMPPERIDEILAGAGRADGSHGYGLRNIHERLVLNYGPQFGLAFRSSPGAGTTVTVRVPASFPAPPVAPAPPDS